MPLGLYPIGFFTSISIRKSERVYSFPIESLDPLYFYEIVIYDNHGNLLKTFPTTGTKETVLKNIGQ